MQENALFDNGLYPAYGASGIAGYTDRREYSSDAVLIVKDGSGVGTVSRVRGDYSFIGTLNLLTAKSGYYLSYLYYALMAFKFEPYVTGMAIPHIYFKDYGKGKIHCPSYDEQVKIGKALSLIEEKLNVKKSLLSQFIQQKIHLLRQLFI